MRIPFLSSSLRSRLIVLVAVIFVPAASLLILQGINNYRQANEGLEIAAQLMATRIAMYSKETLPEPEPYLAHLSTLPEILSGEKECAALLRTSLKASYFFDNLFLADARGNIICSGIPLTEPLNVSERSYFKRAVTTKKFALGDYQITTQRKVPVLVFARPILDSTGQVSHIVGASVQNVWFQEAFLRALADTAGNAGIAATAIDEAGVVVASAPNRSFAGKSVPGWETLRPKLRNRALHIQTETWASGTIRTTAYLPIYVSDAANLYLRVGIPLQETMAEVQTRNILSLVFFIVGAMLALTAAWWIGNLLVLRPVNRLKRAAADLGNGILSARSGLRGTEGEIGALGVQFDIMADQLQAQHISLERLNRVQAIRSAMNGAMLRAKDEKSLLQETCRIIHEVGRFNLAWVGYAYGQGQTTLAVKACVGIGAGLLEEWRRTAWSATDNDRGPVLRAIQTGSVQVLRNVLESGPDSPWRQALAGTGVRTALGLPIQSGDVIIGGVGIYSTEVDAFSDDEITLLLETANDLGFGINALRADRNLQQSQEMLNLVVENIPSTLVVKEAKSLRVIRVNQAGLRTMGFAANEIIGKSDPELFPADYADRFRKSDLAVLAVPDTVVVTNETIRFKSGTERVFHTKKLALNDIDKRPKYVLSISEDITDRHLAEQRLIYLATHDTLTGLGNRALLQERLGAAWASHENSDYMLALLFIDLDGFKEINDTRGHSIGDELLRQVAGVLQSIVPETNTIARVGGDEFIVLLDKVIGIESVTALAEDIRIRCSQPFYVSDIEVFLSASIGISTFPGPVEHPQALLRTADIAMYHAKGSGRNTFALYSPDMQDKAMKRLEMRNMLRHALERKELVLHYQPRVSLSTGRIVGAEALVRWHSPELGLVSPASFIPLAEESELIRQIGEWVLREACMQASQWQTQGHEPVHIAVNLSTRQLRDAGLLGIIASALEDAGLDPRLLELEVTESAFLEKDPKPLALLNDIHGMDVRLAIDDFGTGYSNLSYLKRLPIDVLKIDQSFIRGVTSDRNDRAIVDTIMALADSLALKVIAEGVETDTQRTLLKTLGCSEYQGFVFSKPLPLPDFSALLAVSRRACD